jgi:hypothetical protein
MAKAMKKREKETVMEAREAFRETKVSKSVTVLLSISVAIGLGVAGAVVTAKLTGSGAVPAAHRIVTSGIPDNSATFGTHRGGTQTVEGPVPMANALQAPDAQERNQQLAAGRVAKPHGYI